MMKSRQILRAVMAAAILLVTVGQPLDLCHGAALPGCAPPAATLSSPQIVALDCCHTSDPCQHQAAKCDCCGLPYLAAEGPFTQSLQILPHSFSIARPRWEPVAYGIFHPPRS